MPDQRIVHGKGQHLFTFTWSVQPFEGDVISDPITVLVAGSSLHHALQQAADLPFKTQMGQPDPDPSTICTCTMGTTCTVCVEQGRGDPGGIVDFEHVHVWGDVQRVGEKPITVQDVGGGLGAAPLDVIGSRAILGQRCPCGEERIMTEAEIAQWKIDEAKRILAHNEMMYALQALRDLQEATVKRRERSVYASWALIPDQCPYCGGEGFTEDESACGDPDCCGSRIVTCHVCQRGAA